MTAIPMIPASLAGGKGSRVTRAKAGTKHFCRISGWRYGAILPKHTVVLVRMPLCGGGDGEKKVEDCGMLVKNIFCFPHYN